mmetsp:Transcript_15237/g.44887  ORF Transcript_15237/g.44887 Transcript_15237/m.44887 type:complete len:336 (-) Transcript_15237:174-1181(-)
MQSCAGVRRGAATSNAAYSSCSTVAFGGPPSRDRQCASATMSHGRAADSCGAAACQVASAQSSHAMAATLAGMSRLLPAACESASEATPCCSAAGCNAPCSVRVSRHCACARVALLNCVSAQASRASSRGRTESTSSRLRANSAATQPGGGVWRSAATPHARLLSWPNLSMPMHGSVAVTTADTQPHGTAPAGGASAPRPRASSARSAGAAKVRDGWTVASSVCSAVPQCASDMRTRVTAMTRSTTASCRALMLPCEPCVSRASSCTAAAFVILAAPLLSGCLRCAWSARVRSASNAEPAHMPSAVVATRSATSCSSTHAASVIRSSSGGACSFL